MTDIEDKVKSAQCRLEATEKEVADNIMGLNIRYSHAALSNLEAAVKAFPAALQERDQAPLYEHASVAVLCAGAAVEVEILSLHLFVSGVLAAHVKRMQRPESALLGYIKRDFDYRFIEVPANSDGTPVRYLGAAKLYDSAEKLVNALDVVPSWPEKDAAILRDLRNAYAHRLIRAGESSAVVMPSPIVLPWGGLLNVHIDVRLVLYDEKGDWDILNDAFKAVGSMAKCLASLNSAREKKGDDKTLAEALRKIGIDPPDTALKA